MNKTELNIKNLTSLWKLAGKNFDGYHSSENIFCSKIELSEWPNRVWTNQPLNSTIIQKIEQKMRNDNRLSFSVFKKPKNEHLVTFEKTFKIKSLQYGMSLPLKNKVKVTKTLDFKKVNDRKNAELWCKSFNESFKYIINVDTILRTQNNVQYFLVHHKKELIGTVVLFVTQSVAGIHSLGILPSKRKQGFASAIMCHILNMAIHQKLTLATLQASEMAKEMYLKMGFSLDFIMENYILKE